MSCNPPARAWAYARASDDKQYAKQASGVLVCNTVDRQIEACQAYYNMHLKPQGVEWGGNEAELQSVSASKHPFLKRPAAIRLLAKMQHGDHLIFDKVDRMWRRVWDFAQVDRVLVERGVNMHIVNLMGASIARGTAMGDFILNVMVSIAQLESQMIGDRVRANNAWRKERGLPIGQPRKGFKIEHTEDGAVLIMDLTARAYARQIIHMRDNLNMAWWRISDAIEKELCLRNGRPYRELRFSEMRKLADRRQWTTDDCKRAYNAEKKTMAEESVVAALELATPAREPV